MGSYSFDFTGLIGHFCHVQHLLVYFQKPCSIIIRDFHPDVNDILFQKKRLISPTHQSFPHAPFVAGWRLLKCSSQSTIMLVTDFFIRVEKSLSSRCFVVFFPHYVFKSHFFFQFCPRFLWKTSFSLFKSLWYSDIMI